MIAGLILTDTEEEESHLAFLDDEGIETYSIKDTNELVDKLVEKQPEIIAADCGTELPREELTQQEEELKEEGYSFTPTSNEKKKVERMRAIERSVQHHADKPPEVIRFDPRISSEELALHGDEALTSFGIDPSDIGSSHQFDAAVGAVTARFYAENQFEDLGVIVPQGLGSSGSEEKA